MGRVLDVFLRYPCVQVLPQQVAKVLRIGNVRLALGVHASSCCLLHSACSLLATVAQETQVILWLLSAPKDG